MRDCFFDSHGDSESIGKVMNKEPFDYTKWQEDLYSDVTVSELSQKAMENRLNKRKTLSN